MTFEPVAAHLAVELARRSSGSARPDAPVVPDADPRPARTAAARARLAVGLHAAARWIEPGTRPAGAAQPS